MEELDAACMQKQASRTRGVALLREGQGARDAVQALMAEKEESFGVEVDRTDLSAEEATALAERVKKEAMESLRQLHQSRSLLEEKLRQAEKEELPVAVDLRTLKADVSQSEQRLHDLMTRARNLPAQAAERERVLAAAVDEAVAGLLKLCQADGKDAEAFCAAADTDGDGALSAEELAALLARLDPPVPEQAREAVETRLGGPGGSIEFLKALLTRRYRCISPIAMLTNFSMADGIENIRALEVGEELTLLEGPAMDPHSNVWRVKLRGADEAIGWVSLQGNQGTVYLEEIAADVVM